ncbi:MAG: type II toxin-antitoxin system VapC family toxin [Nitrososphaerales archaeon]
MAGQKVCLDTTFLVDLLRNLKSAVDKAYQMRRDECEFYTTTINAFELYIGAYRSRKPKRVADVEEILNDIVLLSINRNEAEESAKIFVELMERGEIIDIRDALIAGVFWKMIAIILLLKMFAHFTSISGINVLTY